MEAMPSAPGGAAISPSIAAPPNFLSHFALGERELIRHGVPAR
jgi:hypothetical protein